MDGNSWVRLGAGLLLSATWELFGPLFRALLTSTPAMSLVPIQMPRSRAAVLRMVFAGTLVLFAAVVAPVGSAAGGTGTPAWAPQGPAVAARGRAEVPEGLRELVLWEDLQAMRTFVERVEPLELSGGRETPSVPTLAEVARELRGWEDAFRYVRDRVRYVPYAGSVRGAAATLRSGGGNSVDQALLLSHLLGELGERSRLVRGRLPWRGAARLLDGYIGEAEYSSAEAAHLLWLEMAADHWWVEVDREGSWTALDPSFTGASLGSAYARDPRPLEEVPDTLRATVSAELRVGDQVVARLQAAAVDMAGKTIRAWGTPYRDAADETAADSERASRGEGRAPESQPRPRPGWEPPWPGPWELHLAVAGRQAKAGPLGAAELSALTFHVELHAPRTPARSVEVPWGSLGDTRMVAVTGVGTTIDAMPPVRTAASRLAEAEGVAYRAMRPPKDYAEAARTMRLAAVQAWEAFGAVGPEAVGSALLSALERTIATTHGVEMVTAGLPFAVVRFDPPQDDRSARLAVSLDAPAVVAASGSLGVRDLQLAHGVLQSAVLSQLLHHLSGRPAATAFDATLRAVGSGDVLEWWRHEGAIPEAWTLEGRAAVVADLRTGYGVAAPRTPLGIGEDELIGWWRVAPMSGETSGWVMVGGDRVQGGVELGPPWQAEDLDALLGALRTLHRSLPLLGGYAAEGGSDLETVPETACAAADLAAEVLVHVVPTVERPALVGALCSGVGATITR